MRAPSASRRVEAVRARVPGVPLAPMVALVMPLGRAVVESRPVMLSVSVTMTWRCPPWLSPKRAADELGTPQQGQRPRLEREVARTASP